MFSYLEHVIQSLVIHTSVFILVLSMQQGEIVAASYWNSQDGAISTAN